MACTLDFEAVRSPWPLAGRQAAFTTLCLDVSLGFAQCSSGSSKTLRLHSVSKSPRDVSQSFVRNRRPGAPARGVAPNGDRFV